MNKFYFFTLFLFVSFNLFGQSQFDWELTDGPSGSGLYTSVATNDEYIFVSAGYATYRSVSGDNWERLPIHNARSLAAYQNTLVGIFRTFPLDHGFGDEQLMVSTDNGDNWTIANLPNDSYFRYVGVCSHGIYLSNYSDNLLYRSIDLGQTWESVDLPEPFLREMWIFEDKLYTTLGFNLYISDTNGENFQLIPQSPISWSNIDDIAVSGDNIMVIDEGIFRYSQDGGQTWESHMPTMNYQFKDVDFVGEVVYITGNNGVLTTSYDFGTTITVESLGEPYYEGFLHTIANDNILLGLNYNDGAIRWNASENVYEFANNGLNAGVIYDLEKTSTHLWAATGNGVYNYDFSTETWSADPLLPELFNQNNVRDLAVNENGIVMATVNPNFYPYLSLDSGQTWDSVYIYGFAGFGAETVQVIGDRIFTYKFGVGCKVSDDMGQSFSSDSPACPINGGIVKMNEKHYFAYGNALTVSSDNAVTWETLPPYNGINSIFKLAAAGNHLFAYSPIPIGNSNKYKLFASTDGINWTNVSAGLPDFSVTSTFAYDLEDTFYSVQFHDGKYYLSHIINGLFVSEDNLQTWLPVAPARFSEMILHDNYLYAGGFHGGVIRFIPPEAFGGIFFGKVYFDDNNNGTQEGNELPFSGQKVSLDAPSAWNPFYFTTTDNDGLYSLGVYENPIDTIRPLIPSNYVESVNPPFYLSGDAGTDKDFGVYFTPNITDMQIGGYFHPYPRPGYDSKIGLYYKNIGTIPASGKVSLKLDPNISYLNANPLPSEIFTDSLVWDFTDMDMFENHYININVNTPASVPLETIISNTAYVIPNNTDEDFANNISIFSDEVVGAFDPNDKRVVPTEGLTATEIAEGKELYYTIRFQNTGTLPADRVRITDMLDTALYYPSLRLVQASHEVTSFDLRPTGMLEVIFDDIQLADSLSNEPESHGFVTYAIQRKKHFNPTNPVKNYAAIYFDFNEPIYTNEVIFTVPEMPTATTELPKTTTTTLKIYPNPSKNFFTVDSNNLLIGKGQLQLSDLSGKVIMQQPVKDFSQLISIKNLEIPVGVYFIQLNNGKQIVTGKVIVIE